MCFVCPKKTGYFNPCHVTAGECMVDAFLICKRRQRLQKKILISPFSVYSFFTHTQSTVRFIETAANQDWAVQEQTVRLYNLQLERERLRKRQQEIKSHVSHSRESDSWAPAITRGRTQEVMRFDSILSSPDGRRSVPVRYCRSHPSGVR